MKLQNQIQKTIDKCLTPPEVYPDLNLDIKNIGVTSDLYICDNWTGLIRTSSVKAISSEKWNKIDYWFVNCEFYFPKDDISIGYRFRESMMYHTNPCTGLSEGTTFNTIASFNLNSRFLEMAKKFLLKRIGKVQTDISSTKEELYKLINTYNSQFEENYEIPNPKKVQEEA